MRENRVQRVVDTGLASLSLSEGEVGALLARARGGGRVKRRLHAALALALALVVMAGGVAAVTLGWTQAAHFLNKERQGSTFHQWSAQEQRRLVASLVADGHIEETEQVKRLRDDSLDDGARSAIARDIMTGWLAAPQEQVAFRPIMEKIWGDFRTWTVEQKVWYTNTLTEAGVQSPDTERYVLPAPGALDGATAIRIARAQAAAWMGIPFERLAQYQAFSEHVILSKETEQNGQRVYTTENQPPVWLVELTDQQAQTYPQQLYVEVDPHTGWVNPRFFVTALRMGVYGYQDWPDIAVHTERFIQEQGFDAMPAWTNEARAQWSEDVRSMVQAMTADSAVDPVTLAYSRYAYGVPGADALLKKEAIAAARRVARSLPGVTRTSLDAYEVAYALYDVTGITPLWRVHLAPLGRQADAITHGSPETAPRYRVELDAKTGAVVSAQVYTLKELSQGEGIAGML